MLQQEFVIGAEHLVSGKTSVKMKVPTYQDLRWARRNFPYDKQERLGYQLDDLLIAYLLLEVNGEADYKSIDTIDKLADMPVVDRNAINQLMVEMFFISKEKLNLSQERARESRNYPHDFYEIKAEDSPSGTFSCKFMEPAANAQMQAERRYGGVTKEGAGLEEFFFAYCLDSLNGEDISNRRDKLSYLDDCEIADIQYATNYFVMLSSLDEDSRADLKKSAVSIKQSLLKQLVVSPGNMPTATVALSSDKMVMTEPA